jgi:hypothetical protein
MVSTIIVNYNGQTCIEKCLQSVLNSNYPHLEVIVVDNASTDSSLGLIEKYSHDSRLRLITNRQNLGFSEASNQGAREAHGLNLFFLNNDTEIERDTILQLVRVIEQDRSIGAAQSKILMMSNKTRLDSAGDTISIIGWPRSLGKLELDRGQFDFVPEIFSGRGAALMVPKRIFDAAGGFDSHYFMYYEDVDLSWRIRLQGYKVALAPHSIVYHEGGATAKSNNAQRKVLDNLYSGKNYFATLVKNLELHNLLLYGTLHLVVHVGTVAYYSLKGRSYEALGLLFALVLIVRDLPISWRKRLVVQNIRLVSDREIFSKTDSQTIARYFRQAFARSIPPFFTYPNSNR